jgi:hypothetical protein
LGFWILDFGLNLRSARRNYQLPNEPLSRLGKKLAACQLDRAKLNNLQRNFMQNRSMLELDETGVSHCLSDRDRPGALQCISLTSRDDRVYG